MSHETLHLVVPGLLSPPQGTHGSDKLRASTLEKFLNLCSVSDADRDYEHQLFSLMGLPQDTAAAPYAYLGDGGYPGEDVWMQADPVHMKTDLTRLLLFEGKNLDISLDEADALAEEFNDHFEDDGLELYVPHAERWYFLLDEIPNIETHPVAKVSGRSPDAFMPTGEDATFWQSMLMETQMLFHGSEVNRERAAHGKPPVNSLWIHSPGRQAASLTPVVHFKTVVADDPLALGLARRLVLLKPKSLKRYRPMCCV